MDKAVIIATARALGYRLLVGERSGLYMVNGPNGNTLIDTINQDRIDLSHWAVIDDMRNRYGIKFTLANSSK